jgi:hypothetical protein
VERHRRVSLRPLCREPGLGSEMLAALSDELVQVQHVAVVEVRRDIACVGLLH